MANFLRDGSMVIKSSLNSYFCSLKYFSSSSSDSKAMKTNCSGTSFSHLTWSPLANLIRSER